MFAMRRTAALLALATALPLAACSVPSSEASFDSTNPADRTRAMAQAGQNPTPKQVRGLITELDSEDPAQRMFAIRTLERLTGETRGFRHAAPEPERAEAVDRWVEWYESGRWSDDIAEHRAARSG